MVWRSRFSNRHSFTLNCPTKILQDKAPPPTYFENVKRTVSASQKIYTIHKSSRIYKTCKSLVSEQTIELRKVPLFAGFCCRNFMFFSLWFKHFIVNLRTKAHCLEHFDLYFLFWKFRNIKKPPTISLTIFCDIKRK